MKCLAIACAFFSLSFHATAQTYYDCDFEKGVPADFTLTDYDQNKPSASMQKLGFAVGTPWIAIATNKAATNHAACSTSWYTPAGTSDDWMVTPPITLSGSHPTLSWRAMAADAKHADGYAVYVSESGATGKEGFDLSSPLFATTGEQADWVEHAVSLSQYAGKTVTIAFVNNSTDCSRLYIDDIKVEEHHRLALSVDLPTGINRMGALTVSGQVKADVATHGFTIKMEACDTTTEQHFDADVAAGEAVPFVLDRKLTVGKHETVPYTLWAVPDGDKDVTPLAASVTAYPQKVVCEEGTGTWCGYCVRGLVMLDSIKKYYSDRIIGIAAHSGDVMASDYLTAVSQYFGSAYPTGSVNRRVTCDPRDFIAYSDAVLNYKEILSDIALSVSFDRPTRTVKATTTLHFAEAQPGNRLALAYAIIENAVHKSGDEKYSQHNSYANGAEGPMGGYEKYGDYIPSEVMYYDDVARGYVDDLLGIDGSVPADVEAEQPVVDERSFVLPDNILDDDHVEIVAMLIDKTDGRIVNAESMDLVKGDPATIADRRVDAHLTAASIYSLGGVRLSTGQRGILLVRTNDGQVMKVMR